MLRRAIQVGDPNSCIRVDLDGWVLGPRRTEKRCVTVKLRGGRCRLSRIVDDDVFSRKKAQRKREPQFPYGRGLSVRRMKRLGEPDRVFVSSAVRPFAGGNRQ